MNSRFLKRAFLSLLFAASVLAPSYLQGQTRQIRGGCAREEARAVLAAKVKDGIARLGTGEEAQVRLTLFDKSVLAGFIGEAGEQQFVLVSREIELRRTIDYDQIERLHGRNSGTGFRVSVGEGSKPLKILIRLARRKLRSGGPGTKTVNEYLSKPAVVILVVLAIGVILIGVELGKS